MSAFLEGTPGQDFSASIQAVADGSQKGLEDLYQAFSSLVYATAYRVLNDVHDAEEITQEVFANVWSKAKLFDQDRGRPEVWLSTMARNRAIDRLRSKRRRAQLRDDLEANAVTEPTDGQDDVFAQVRLHEESRVLHNAILQLKPEQREVIEMTYFRGLSQSQAAEKLGTPLGTVKARIRRGISRLRTLIPEPL
jgi:RNA polymerase sigma-70 factor, ECF subfamily